VIILYSIVLGRCCLITCLSRSVDYFLYMEEIWRDIQGFEWLYEISNMWSVKSNIKFNGTNTRILSPENLKWYRRVVLRKHGKSYKKTIHRLVAQAFIPNPENKPVINHINWIKDDNRLENLEWCTLSENTLHSFRKLWRKWPCFWMKWKWNFNSIKVWQYDLRGTLIKEFDSLYLCWIELWIFPQNLSRCINWKGKTAKWFIFKKIENGN